MIKSIRILVLLLIFSISIQSVISLPPPPDIPQGFGSGTTTGNSSSDTDLPPDPDAPGTTPTNTQDSSSSDIELPPDPPTLSVNVPVIVEEDQNGQDESQNASVQDQSNESTDNNIEDTDEIVSLTFNSNIQEMSLHIDDSQVSNLEGPVRIRVKESGITIVEFDYILASEEFNLSDIDLSDVLIQKQNNTDFGYLIVKGIPLQEGITKSLSIDNIDSVYNGVCIKDREISSITEISSECNGNYEHIVECDGVENHGYTCVFISSSDKYKVTGLNYSGVRQFEIVEVNDTQEEDDGDVVIQVDTVGNIPLPPEPPLISSGNGDSSQDSVGTMQGTVDTLQDSVPIRIRSRDEEPGKEESESQTQEVVEESTEGKNIFSYGYLFLLIIAISISVIGYNHYKKNKPNQRFQRTYLKRTSDPNLRKLRKYITEGVKRGYTARSLKKVLLKNGWQEDKIEEVFREMEHGR